MFLRRNIMIYTARHTLYKTRLTGHVHVEQTKQYLNRSIQTQEKKEYGYMKLKYLLPIYKISD